MHSSRAQHARRASAVAALVAAVALGLAACTAGDATAGPATTQAGGAAPGGTTGGATPAPGAGGGSASGPGSDATTGSGAQTGAGAKTGSGKGNQPTPAATDPGTEIIPTATPTPYHLPGLSSAKKKSATPPLVAKAPKTASAHGRLVAGFPKKAVPVPAGFTIVSSSVTSQGRHLQVTLQASSDSSPKAVRKQLTSAFTKLGYTATTAAAVPGSSAVQLTHGTDGVVVTLHGRLGGGTELTLTGAFTTAS